MTYLEDFVGMGCLIIYIFTSVEDHLEKNGIIVTFTNCFYKHN